MAHCNKRHAFTSNNKAHSNPLLFSQDMTECITYSATSNINPAVISEAQRFYFLVLTLISKWNCAKSVLDKGRNVWHIGLPTAFSQCEIALASGPLRIFRVHLASGCGGRAPRDPVIALFGRGRLLTLAESPRAHARTRTHLTPAPLYFRVHPAAFFI